MTPRSSIRRRIATKPAGTAEALAKALDLVSDGVLLLGSNLEVLAANTRAAELLGSPALCGACLANLLSPPSAARLRAIANSFASASATKLTLHLDTSVRPAVSFELTLHPSPQGDPESMIAIVQPARGVFASSLDPSSERDYLTGLPTRAALAARLQQVNSHAHESGKAYAILFIDLDAFKQLNDDLGHTAGDCVLAAVAARLQATVRPHDLVARYGGDEFVIVIDEISAPQLARLARRLRITLAAPLEVAGQWITATASIGRAFGDGTRPALDVLDEADRAMYDAKSAQRRKLPR